MKIIERVSQLKKQFEEEAIISDTELGNGTELGKRLNFLFFFKKFLIRKQKMNSEKGTMLNSIEERVSRVSKINKRGTRIDPGTFRCY